MPSASLIVSTSHASLAGRREQNEDFVGMVTPGEPELSSKGMLIALADGVSGNDGGRAAAEYAVRGLLCDYYATPDTWEITTAFDKVLSAINSWVQQQGNARREVAGMATTLTSLVLRGRSYYTAHVGDSRAYLYRGGRLFRLTEDHVWDRPEMHHVLTRAIGLDRHLTIDHGMGELELGDVFLLASDGFWSAFTEAELKGYLNTDIAGSLPGATAERLCQLALAGGSQDNISAVLIRVDALPEGDLRDTLGQLANLPVPPKLKVGQHIDGLQVEEILHSSTATILYRVLEPVQKRMLVLKTLQPDRGTDQVERSVFAHESWLAKRVVARFFPEVIAPLQRNYLYYLMTYHAGQSMQQKLDSGAHFTFTDIIKEGSKLVRATGALHRRNIIHRDIKPDNVHLGEDGELRLLDLGVAQSGWQEYEVSALAGTPSFLAPEQFARSPADRQTDLYAVGVTLYYALTRHYPYGEIEPFQHPKFDEPIPASRYRPDIPLWLDTVLLKAVARDVADRFETAEEFLLSLERGPTRPLPAKRPDSMLKRDPLRLWRNVALLSLLLNVLLLYWVLAR